MLLIVILTQECKFEPDLPGLTVKVVAWLTVRSWQIIDNSRQSGEILGSISLAPDGQLSVLTR